MSDTTFLPERLISEYQAKGCCHGDAVQVSRPQRSASRQGCTAGWSYQGHGKYGNSQKSDKQSKIPSFFFLVKFVDFIFIWWHLVLDYEALQAALSFWIVFSLLFVFRWENDVPPWWGSVTSFCLSWRRWRNTAALFIRLWKELHA